MTFNTPDGTDGDRRWCDRCDLSVDPDPGDDGPVCPACGETL